MLLSHLVLSIVFAFSDATPHARDDLKPSTCGSEIEDLIDDGAVSYLQRHAASLGEKASADLQPKATANANSQRATAKAAACVTGQLARLEIDSKVESLVMLEQPWAVYIPQKNCKEQSNATKDARVVSYDELHSSLLSLMFQDVKSFGAVDRGFASQLTIYSSSLVLCGLIVTVIYWPLGALPITKILGYLFAGCVVSLSVKLVYQDSFGFHFPRLLTTFHLIVSAALGFCMLFYRKRFQGKPIHVPTFSELVFKLLPLCLGFSYSLGCANMALMYCSVAFAAIIGASTPFFSILLMVSLGMHFDWYLLLPVSGIVFGCMSTVAGTLEFSMYGLILLLMANLGRASKAVCQQWVMTGEVKEKYDPITLLSWQCLICIPIMLVWSAFTEGTPAFAILFQQAQPMVFFGVVFLSCAIASALNALHIFVIKDLGAVGIQATAQLKQGLTVLGGIMLFGEAFTPASAIGAAIVMLSAFWYSRASSNSKSAAKQPCSQPQNCSPAQTSSEAQQKINADQNCSEAK